MLNFAEQEVLISRHYIPLHCNEARFKKRHKLFYYFLLKLLVKQVRFEAKLFDKIIMWFYSINKKFSTNSFLSYYLFKLYLL